MKTIKLIIILLALTFCTHLSFSQKTEFYIDIREKIQTAKELFKHSKYIAAFRQFEEIQKLVAPQSEIFSEAEYYKSYALLKSGGSNGNKMLTDFIQEFPESPYLNQAKFNMGSYQFDKRRYALAIKNLKTVDKAELSKNETELYYFQLGYSYMMQSDLDKAATEFFQIKDDNNIYSKPASYYWAHINYINENYESALEGFSKLNGDPTYSIVIPLYVSHIYYKQEKYDEIINYTVNIIDDVEESHKTELSKIVGDSYFHLKQFNKAIPFLEVFHKSKGLKSKEDNYLLGYSYYNTKEYANAIPYLEKASKGKDELAQNAYYHLADCYVRIDQKQKARIAFEAAAELNFDEQIKEDALFNYAKITYELSYSPFSETIKAFDKYISSYPDSERNNSAYQYLVQVYMVTRNYKDAIKSIEKIKIKNSSINRAYQRVTFFRGLEQFNDQDYNTAIKNFNKSLSNSLGDRSLTARAIYWKAESLYRIGDYNSAINEYNKFLLTPGAFSSMEYQDAHYNLAYAFFNLEDYSAANSSFRKFLTVNPGKRTEKTADALNRVGDSYFLMRNYNEAINNYKQSYEMKIYDPDYALFRMGFCEGLLRNQQEKIVHLRSLLSDYSNSNYRDDALYELGRAYERVDQSYEAINLYNEITENYKQSQYYKKALIQLGLINYNNGNIRKSLQYYKEVVENFQNSEEAEAALNGIKNNYVELNDIDTYFKYTQQLGRGTVTASEQDALTYQAAEKQFMAGDKNAVSQFERYLNDFPNGQHKLNAHFYLAEALYANSQFSESLEHYNFVVNQNDNIFSEPAIAKAAELTLNGQNYERALDLFKRLEILSNSSYNTLHAYRGKMKCNFELKNYQDAIPEAQKVQKAEKASDAHIRDAEYILAKSYYFLAEYDQALNSFKKLAKETKSTQGAEAKYLVAEIQFKKQELKPAENEIMDFISKGTPHQLWLGKSFILLSDIYQANGDDFQAKHTLKSVVENYGNNTDGIIKNASEKLAAIEAKENAEQQKAKENPVEINIDNQNE